MPDEQRSEQNRRRTGKLSTRWHKEASRLQGPANRRERLRWTRKLLHFQAWAGPWRNGGPAHDAHWHLLRFAAMPGRATTSGHAGASPENWWSRGSLLVLSCSGTCWPSRRCGTGVRTRSPEPLVWPWPACLART